jgi:hypothetical protein
MGRTLRIAVRACQVGEDVSNGSRLSQLQMLTKLTGDDRRLVLYF